MNFIGQDGLDKKDLDNNKTLIFNEFSLLQCFEIRVIKTLLLCKGLIEKVLRNIQKSKITLYT